MNEQNIISTDIFLSMATFRACFAPCQLYTKHASNSYGLEKLFTSFPGKYFL